VKQAEYQDKITAVEDALTDGSERTLGTCVASWPSAFRSKTVAIVATDRRLLVQEIDRKINPQGDVISLPPERIESAELSGVRGRSVSSAVMNAATITIKLRTTDGQKMKLVTMAGDGMFGGMNGASEQRQAVEAVLGRLGLIEPGNI